jgi:hypothetical protein
MKTPFALLAAGLAAMAGVGHAQDGKPAQTCFLRGNVQNFSAPDARTVYIRVGVKDVWRLDLMSDCLDLPFRQSIGLASTPGDPWICKPVEATIITRGMAIPHRCPVQAMRRLTPDELAALPRFDRP